MNLGHQQCSLKRIQGSLLGLAAGDAVGTTLKFKPPDTFQPITDMVGGGPFDLETALWTFWNSSDFCKGCLKAVNLGDDADTTGAVYGQIAGAYYGVDSIPLEWWTKLAMRTTIEKFASQLHELSGLDKTMLC